jgi:transposase
MEKDIKQSNYKLTPQGQEELRLRIVRKMKKHKNPQEVAEICECTVRHVNKTWKKYLESGIDSLLAVEMGRPGGSGCKLTPEQESTIIEILTTKRPNEVGLAGYLWERKSVSEVIKQKFGIKMPLSTTGNYLAKWNFTSQRPKKRL